jgi:mono/diheme cytochrome c family protein
MKRVFIAIAVVVAAAIAVGFVVLEDKRIYYPLSRAVVTQDVERGLYLVRAGNCLSCHTVPGGKPYAGGRAIPTPYGTLYSSNITPDPETGIGRWSADDFWRALHEGRSKDGSLLYPAFPYPNYTKVAREDADAMHAYLQSLAPVAQKNRPHEMRFPYDKRPLLAGWRAIYFRQGIYEEDTTQTPQWNRGAYLVQGLGHCNACHAQRGFWGSVDHEDVGGGLIPVLNWYAPSLAAPRDISDMVEFMKTGVSRQHAAFGPMAEVVRHSLQHLTDYDLTAIAVYLASQRDAPPAQAGSRVSPAQRDEMMKQGARVYADRCAECHQENGKGVPRVYPALAGNASVLTPNPINAVRITLNGGFPPSTQGNPRPFGMPPFAHVLSDGDVAAVVTYIRGAWGNRAAAVSIAEVSGARGVPLD